MDKGFQIAVDFFWLSIILMFGAGILLGFVAWVKRMLG